jgi:hypothetical protein
LKLPAWQRDAYFGSIHQSSSDYLPEVNYSRFLAGPLSDMIPEAGNL